MKNLSKDEMKKIIGGSGPGDPSGCGSYLNHCSGLMDPPCCDGYVCTPESVDGYSYHICLEGNPGGV